MSKQHHKPGEDKDVAKNQEQKERKAEERREKAEEEEEEGIDVEEETFRAVHTGVTCGTLLSANRCYRPPKK